MKDLSCSTMLHYVLRTEPNKNKKPILVEAINAINPFIKPGFNYVSVTVNKKNLEDFKKFLDQGLVEAYFHY
jgi:MoaA/NifB/PqqE/SkfB family radical SAM enzyme